MRDLASTARYIADRLRSRKDALDIEAIRDICDHHTGIELDAFALDLLTDRVVAELNRGDR